MASRQRDLAWQADTRLLDALPQAALAIDPDGGVVQVNEAARQMLGGQAGNLVGTRLTESMFGDAGGGGEFEDVLTVVMAGGSWSGQLAVTPHHGLPLKAELSVRPVLEDGEVSGALVLVTEVLSNGKETERLSERLTRLARVETELVRADSLEEVTKTVVDHMADAAGATVASLSLLVDSDTLALVGLRGGRKGVASRWATYPLSARTPAGDAIRENRILVLNGRAEIRSRYPDLESAAEGERSMACLPLRVGESVSWASRRCRSPARAPSSPPSWSSSP